MSVLKVVSLRELVVVESLVPSRYKHVSIQYTCPKVFQVNMGAFFIFEVCIVSMLF